MTEKGAATLRARRLESLEVEGVEPRQWRKK